MSKEWVFDFQVLAVFLDGRLDQIEAAMFGSWDAEMQGLVDKFDGILPATTLVGSVKLYDRKDSSHRDILTHAVGKLAEEKLMKLSGICMAAVKACLDAIS